MKVLPYHRFTRTVSMHPDEAAIDLGDRSVSYQELAWLVAGAAGHLENLGLPPSSRVGLVGHGRLATYVAYLAILRLGHVVVPLGPDNPVAFSATVLRLAEAAAVILDANTDIALSDLLAAVGTPELDAAACLNHVCPATPAVAAADDLAYILFTSGSTGKPKGVPISNRNVTEYLDQVLPECGLEPGARTSHAFALTFDPSVFDLLATWSSGATLVVPRGRELLAPAHYVTARRLTHWYSVPSLIAYARRIGNLRPRAMPHLRRSMFIGEPLSKDMAEAWRLAAPNSEIINVYGPTELTVSCSAFRLPPDSRDWPPTHNGTLPIGQIYPRLGWFLRGPDGGPGDEGELCVRGSQRFGGYLDPADDGARFVRTAGATTTVLATGAAVNDDDWYRTGDQVRLQDGLLVHLGRVDRQVKISGHRIELGYVEAVIRQHPAVDESAVVAVPTGQNTFELRAAICGDRAKALDLSEFLAEAVPPYMIPTVSEWFAELPLNGSGKVDYVRLASVLQKAQ